MVAVGCLDIQFSLPVCVSFSSLPSFSHQMFSAHLSFHRRREEEKKNANHHIDGISYFDSLIAIILLLVYHINGKTCVYCIIASFGS